MKLAWNFQVFRTSISARSALLSVSVCKLLIFCYFLAESWVVKWLPSKLSVKSPGLLRKLSREQLKDQTQFHGLAMSLKRLDGYVHRRALLRLSVVRCKQSFLHLPVLPLKSKIIKISVSTNFKNHTKWGNKTFQIVKRNVIQR